MLSFLVTIFSGIITFVYFANELESAKLKNYRNISIIETDHKYLNVLFLLSVIFSLSLQETNAIRATILIAVTTVSSSVNIYMGFKAYQIHRRSLFLVQSILIASNMYALAYLINFL